MAEGSSLTDAAYRAIRAEVLSCRLLPGEKLTIAALCARLGYSLGAVREALSRLTSEGLVEAQPQRGFRVAAISESDLRDLTETRAGIEAQCLARAIANGGEAWERDIASAYSTMTSLPQREAGAPDRVGEGWADAHGRFHAALVQACDSRWLLRLREQLYAQSERYRRLSVPLARKDRDLDGEHRDIMDATLARDVDRAVERLRAHLMFTTETILAAPGLGAASRERTDEEIAPTRRRRRSGA